MAILFANNATSTLAGAISNTATSATLAAGTGVLFPSPTGGDYFVMTFTDAATGLLTEIVHCTARTGDVLTIVRAQETTTARNWSSSDLADNLITAGTFAGIAFLDSPAFTGAPTAPTPASNDNSTKIATTAFVTSVLASYAPLASPTFTGLPLAPTAATADNSTKIATTAFVKAQGYATLTNPIFTGNPTGPTPLTADNSQSLATTAFVKNQGYATTSYVNSQGFATTSYVNSQGFITAAALGPYATTSYVNGTFATPSGVTGQINAAFAVGSGYIRFNGGTLFQMSSFTATLGGGGTSPFPIAFSGAAGIVGSVTGANTSNSTFACSIFDNFSLSWGWAQSGGGGSYLAYYIAWGS